MASTEFEDKNDATDTDGTPIVAEWLNEVNDLTHDVFDAADTKDKARTALGTVAEVGTLADLTAIDVSGFSGGEDRAIQGRTTAGDFGASRFVFRNGDQSSNVSSDPDRYFPPDSDATGGSGAWELLYFQHQQVRSLFDLVSISNTAVFDNQEVNVRAFYSTTDTGGGPFYWDAGKAKSDADGGVVIDPDNTGGWDGTQSDIGTLWSAQGTGTGTGCFVRPLNGQLFLSYYGIVNDGTSASPTNNLPAFDSALAKAASENARHIILPTGNFYLDGTWNITKEVRVSGSVSGARQPRTSLYFPTDTRGVDVQNPARSGDEKTQGTTLEYFGIEYKTKGTSGDGLYNDHRIVARCLFIRNAGRYGWFVDGTTNNTNGWFGEYIRIETCRSHGLFVDGADANAGMAMIVDASDNGGWGIYDSSFLGNTYIACHTAANSSGAYKTDDANARNVLIGCYSESGQTSSQFERNTQVIGGIHAAGFNDSQTSFRGGVIIEERNALRHGATFTERAFDTQGDQPIVEIRDDPDSFIHYRTQSVDSGLRFKWDGTSFRYDWANSDNNIGMAIHPAASTVKFGRNNPPTPPSFDFPDGFFNGDITEGRRYYTARKDVPTDADSQRIGGDWAQGDFITHIDPTPGEPAGWIVTTAGEFGTATTPVFSPFGQAGHRENSGDPTGSVTPHFVGEELLDTTNTKWYKSTGTANTDWAALN